MQPFLFTLPHHSSSLLAFSVQLIRQRDYLSVQFLIGIAHLQEITLESCHFSSQGITLASRSLSTNLQGTILVD